MAKQPVIVKGQRNGISIMLDETVEFTELEEALREKLANAKKFFDGANSAVAFKGRDLSETEERHLLDIIMAETNLRVDFVESSGTATKAPQHITPAPEEPTATKTRQNIHETAFYNSGLRSGQSINFHGSVVIRGDVNPGSEVVADGNVIILGALKGMAHAGANGDESCFVSALTLRPTQLRIGKLITYVPEQNTKNTPSYAYVRGDEVFIAAL
ncbi:MAG: septum site-determining protein MinC [Defluviitaleaceae bacterium]|nr:septum site-determining protein MinC [Defluviitaleaceae bacterium]